MKMGYFVTSIASTKINSKTLGSIKTIIKDVNIINSRWLEMDPKWFHHARLTRIEAKERLLEQLIRVSELITKIQNGDFNL